MGPLGSAFLFRDGAMRSSLLVVNAGEGRISGLFPEASGTSIKAAPSRAAVIDPCSVSELALQGESREMECPLGMVSVGVAHSAFPLPDDVSSYLLFREVGSGMPVSVCGL